MFFVAAVLALARAATDLFALPEDPPFWSSTLSGLVPFSYNLKAWSPSWSIFTPTYGPDVLYPKLNVTWVPPAESLFASFNLVSARFLFAMKMRLEPAEFKSALEGRVRGLNFELFTLADIKDVEVVGGLRTHFKVSHSLRFKQLIGTQFMNYIGPTVGVPIEFTLFTHATQPKPGTENVTFESESDIDSYALCARHHTFWFSYEPSTTPGSVLISVGLGNVSIYSSQTTLNEIVRPILIIGTPFESFEVDRPRMSVSTALLFTDPPASLELSSFRADLVRSMDAGTFDHVEVSSRPPSPPPPAPASRVSVGPPSTRNSESDPPTRTYIAVGVGLGGGILLLVALGLALFKQLTRNKAPVVADPESLDTAPTPLRKSKSLASTHDFGTFDSLALDVSQLPDYERVSMCLASGYFGSVYIIQWEGKPAALKVFDFTSRPAHVAADYTKEIAVLSRLDHPNIIRMIGHGMDDARGKGYVLMELAEGLSLFDLLYPKVDLVIPSDIPGLPETAQSGWAAMSSLLLEEFTRTMRMHPDFLMFRLATGPVMNCSKEGRDLVAQCVFGSRLAPASALWERLLDTPELTRILYPTIILTVGPLCLAFPVDAMGCGDGTFLRSCLLKLVDTYAPKLSLRDRTRICLETWRACNYLHNLPGGKKIIHSDLKPANILLDRNLHVKLADVGMALVLQLPAQQSFLHSIRNQGTMGGTMGYRDPERTKGPGKRSRYGEKNDVFSFGVCMIELFTLGTSDSREVGSPEFQEQLEEIASLCTGPWDSRCNSNELLTALERLNASLGSPEGTLAPTQESSLTISIDGIQASQESDFGSEAMQALRSQVGERSEPWMISKDSLPDAWKRNV